ncbi:Ja19 [Japanese cytomegalovirus]|nr:Ja19 [Japanese cytomegalovirus]
MQISKSVYASLIVLWVSAVAYGQTSDSSSNSTTPWTNTSTRGSVSTSQPTTIQVTTERTASESGNSSNLNSTTAPSWTTIADTNATTVPPWPVEIQDRISALWTNGCYCGSLSVLPGANVTLNSTKKQTNTETMWFVSEKLNNLLCIFYFANQNDSMDYDNLTFTCTQNNITLWNVLERNSGIYCEIQSSLSTYNSTYICYNLTVTADASNATNPLITTTKCHVTRKRYYSDDTSVGTLTTSDTTLSIEDILDSRRDLQNNGRSNLLGSVIQFVWLGVIVIGSTITLALVFRVPQKVCSLFYHCRYRYRGYEKIPGQIL